jgi:hypothetical protein
MVDMRKEVKTFVEKIQYLIGIIFCAVYNCVMYSPTCLETL